MPTEPTELTEPTEPTEPSSATAWTERLIAGSPCLARHPHGRIIATIAGEALASVDPRGCVLRATHRLAKPIGEAAVIGEFVFDLAAEGAAPGPSENGSIWVFGAGKASAAMAAALVERFGSRVAGGLVIVKHATPLGNQARGEVGGRGTGGSEPLGRAEARNRIGALEVMLGDHPIPGPRTAAAVARLRELAARVGPRDLVLCPISGGASALLSEPMLSPAHWAELHTWMLSHDVSIQAVNKLRRRFDRLKAGGLARLFAPATVVGLMISDVVGDELALIGSGPTVYASEAEIADYPALLRELDDRLAALSPGLRAALSAPELPPEHPRNRDGLPQGVHQVLLARNGDAREAACRAAQAVGLDSLVLLPALGGLASDEGRRLAQLLTSEPPFTGLPIRSPACVVTGGETTVALGSGPTGLGGRNQELALAAIETLGRAQIEDVALLTLATDGEDGPTDAAGALVSGASLARARASGVDLTDALSRHASHEALAQLDALVRTGPTGTNVCDLALLFRFGPAS